MASLGEGASGARLAPKERAHLGHKKSHALRRTTESYVANLRGTRQRLSDIPGCGQERRQAFCPFAGATMTSEPVAGSEVKRAVSFHHITSVKGELRVQAWRRSQVHLRPTAKADGIASVDENSAASRAIGKGAVDRASEAAGGGWRRRSLGIAPCCDSQAAISSREICGAAADRYGRWVQSKTTSGATRRSGGICPAARFRDKRRGSNDAGSGFPRPWHVARSCFARRSVTRANSDPARWTGTGRANSRMASTSA